METTLINGDCLEVMKTIPDNSVDCVITSPPYNLNKDYGTYKDNRSDYEYSCFMEEVATILCKKVKSHLFLNIGFTPTQPWIALKIGSLFAGFGWKLQNNIAWIKHIKVETQCNGPLYGNRHYWTCL